jgi:hypothetical protein
MKQLKRLGLFGGLMLALALSPLAACGTTTYVVDDGEVWVERAPPPPRFDRRPPLPGPGHVWVSGYWYWTGGGYVWRAGFWDVPPYNGHVWVDAGWVFHQGRYRYVPGRWSAPARRPHYNYVTRPLPPAYRPTRPGRPDWRDHHRNRPPAHRQPGHRGQDRRAPPPAQGRPPAR